MRRLTTAWTDAHVWLIVLAGVLVSLGYLGTPSTAAAPAVTAITLATVVAAFAFASFTDAFGGLLVGLVAAATYTAMRQYLPDSGPTDFVRQSVVLFLLLMVGLSSGIVADRIRRGRRIADRAGDHAVLPVAGSLGLVSAQDAEQVLADETVRAELHGRPLTTAVVTVRMIDDGLADDDVRRARRAVARALESELRVTDVVFAAADDQFGVILPETTEAAAPDVIEPALMLARAATFADRGRGHRRLLTEVAELEVVVTPVVAPVAPVVAARSGRSSRTGASRTRRQGQAGTGAKAG